MAQGDSSSTSFASGPWTSLVDTIHQPRNSRGHDRVDDRSGAFDVHSEGRLRLGVVTGYAGYCGEMEDRVGILNKARYQRTIADITRHKLDARPTGQVGVLQRVTAQVVEQD